MSLALRVRGVGKTPPGFSFFDRIGSAGPTAKGKLFRVWCPIFLVCFEVREGVPNERLESAQDVRALAVELFRKCENCTLRFRMSLRRMAVIGELLTKAELPTDSRETDLELLFPRMCPREAGEPRRETLVEENLETRFELRRLSLRKTSTLNELP